MINNNPLSFTVLNYIGGDVQTLLSFQYGDCPSQTKLILQVQLTNKNSYTEVFLLFLLFELEVFDLKL